jgi:hypothetical protein
MPNYPKDPPRNRSPAAAFRQRAERSLGSTSRFCFDDAASHGVHVDRKAEDKQELDGR